MEDIHGARPLAIFGDSVTTDHISPAGAIKATSPAGVYLQERGVTPLVTGRVIVASLHPHEKTIVDVIAKLGLELQVIFNKGAVMVLPTGVNKATGLIAALQELKLSAHNVVGIGDAENDHSFLSLCECSVAVANAIPSLKEQADYTTKAENGDGVIELIEQLLADDLKTLDQRVGRRHTQST